MAFKGRGRRRGGGPTLERWFPSNTAPGASGYADRSHSRAPQESAVSNCAAAETPESSGAPVFVVWHKWSDLRVSDHEPLVSAHVAASRAGGSVLHIHVLEQDLLMGRSRIAKVRRCGARRAVFWRESAADLACRLHSLGQRLLVLTDADGGIGAVFERLCSSLLVRKVYAHQELCDEELRTEAVVASTLARHGASLETCWGGLTVHHIEDLGFDASDTRQMPNLYQPFLKKMRNQPVRQPLAVPARLCPPPSELYELGHSGEEGVQRAFGALGAPLTWTPPPSGVGKLQDVDWRGGETAAYARLRHYVWESGKLKKYVGASDSMTPGDNNAVNSGTRMSPWLAFGCISARAVVSEVRRFERVQGKSRATYWVYHELVFRDFFRFSCLVWGASLFKVEGPYNVRGLEWRRDAELFDKWRAGETGFPFVDAGMRELAATGYISHLHRQCCAAFLVRDLRLDWRMGAEHFEALLLDHTPDANWGNWAYRILQRPQLVANGCPVVEHVTTIEVIAWPVVHDSRLEHILAWLPELRGLPRDTAREPWRLETLADKRVRVKPYKDSPLWFCSVNRVNWQEYDWLSGFAWTTRQGKPSANGSSAFRCADFVLGRDYPRPLVPPLDIEFDLDRLPVQHAWGDTDQSGRPHVWGQPGMYAGEQCPYATPDSKPSEVVDLVVEETPSVAELDAQRIQDQRRPAEGGQPCKQPRRRWVPKVAVESTDSRLQGA